MKYKVEYVVWKTEKAYLESIDADDERFDELWNKNVSKKTTVCKGNSHKEAAADGSVCRDIYVIGEKPEECDMIGRCMHFCHRPADVFDLYHVKH